MKKFMILATILAVFGVLAVANVTSADFEIVAPLADEAVATEDEGSDEGATDEASDEEATEEPAAESTDESEAGDTEETGDESSSEEPAADESGAEATEETGDESSSEEPAATEPEKSKVVEETPPPPSAPKSKLEQARDAAGKAKARKADRDGLKKQNDDAETSLGQEVDRLLERANTYLDLVEKGVTAETERAARIKSDRADVKALTDEIEGLIKAHVN